MLLAGDIGGTKTALGVYSQDQGPHKALMESEVHSADYGSLESIAKEFLAKTGAKVDRACFDVAGPVIAGRAKITNLPWIVDQASIAKELNLEAVHLLFVNGEGIVQAEHVLLHLIQLALCFVTPHLVFRDASRLFKQFAAFLRLGP